MDNFRCSTQVHECTLGLQVNGTCWGRNHPPQLNFLPWKCIQSCKRHIYLPGVITSNAFAMCLQYIQGDVSDYHSPLSNYKTHQSKANRSWDIWHLREEQAAGLPHVPGLPRCQEGPLSPADFRALEL